MLLIKCPMCGKEISPNAVACPNCGEPVYKENLSNNVKIVDTTETDNNLYHLIIEMCSMNKEKVIDILINEARCTEKEAFKYTNVFPSKIQRKYTSSEMNTIKELLVPLGVKITIEQVSTQSMLYDKIMDEQPRPENTTTYVNTGIKCPNCHSLRTHKISGVSKAGSAILFGVFALGKMSKTWECNACGYRW